MRGIRREWMYDATTAVQRLVGAIVFRELDGGKDVRALLTLAIPPPTNDIERLILDGLIARAQRQPVGGLGWASSVEPLAARAAQLLSERFAEPWTIHRLARYFATNRFTLTTEFRATFGVGVHRYLVRIRIDVAEQRLRSGPEKGEALARDVGFQSRKTLYAAYRRVTGKSLKLNKSHKC